MQSVKEAKDILVKNVKGIKPVSYWIKGNTYVFRTVDRGGHQSSYYIVDGNTVKVTNPILSDLSMNGMKTL